MLNKDIYIRDKKFFDKEIERLKKRHGIDVSIKDCPTSLPGNYIFFVLTKDNEIITTADTLVDLESYRIVLDNANMWHSFEDQYPEEKRHILVHKTYTAEDFEDEDEIEDYQLDDYCSGIIIDNILHAVNYEGGFKLSLDDEYIKEFSWKYIF